MLITLAIIAAATGGFLIGFHAASQRARKQVEQAGRTILRTLASPPALAVLDQITEELEQAQARAARNKE